MVLMAGMDLPIRAIREQVASAVDLIVHQTRFKDGTRRITHITEVERMEGDVITLQDIFVFDGSAGFDADGRVLGRLTRHRAAPQVPREDGLRQRDRRPAALRPRSPVVRRLVGSRRAGSPSRSAVPGLLVLGGRRRRGRRRPTGPRAASRTSSPTATAPAGPRRRARRRRPRPRRRQRDRRRRRGRPPRPRPVDARDAGAAHGGPGHRHQQLDARRPASTPPAPPPSSFLRTVPDDVYVGIVGFAGDVQTLLGADPGPRRGPAPCCGDADA